MNSLSRYMENFMRVAQRFSPAVKDAERKLMSEFCDALDRNNAETVRRVLAEHPVQEGSRLKVRIKPDARDLRAAIETRNPEIVRALVVAHPGIVHEKDRYGRSPLHVIAASGPLETAKQMADIFLAAGADINELSNDHERPCTPRAEAEFWGNYALADYLATKGGERSRVQRPPFYIRTLDWLVER